MLKDNSLYGLQKGRTATTPGLTKCDLNINSNLKELMNRHVFKLNTKTHEHLQFSDFN